MPKPAARTAPGLAGHGAARLTSVHVYSCYSELRDHDGFLGDRASIRALSAILEDWRASELWRHADDSPGRDDAVARLIEMLQEMIGRAESDGRRLAPFIGLGCPGLIREDGSIAKGGQNSPGNWEHKSCNPPYASREAIPAIDGHEVSVLMRNDAVVQGLSEAPFMGDVEHWGVMTIGTGLGNARFRNRSSVR
jgi:hypothetical protein